MKITVGLSSIDDYERLVKAGADEVFCGFVPYEWNKEYGNLFPLNRREVLYYNVQINSYEDMKILSKMAQKYKVPVAITFNYLYYLHEQYEKIASIIKKLIDIGFNKFIIADISLILYLEKKNIKAEIHLSGECSEINSLSINFFKQFKNIKRIIFHRKNTIDDIKSCISRNNNLEYEAFILNEMCHYTGAFCSSLHCDELSHLCLIPYEMGKVNRYSNDFKEVDKRIDSYYDNLYEEDLNDTEDSYIIGATGCGLCALKRLKNSGVNYLKVVGRGNSIDNMERDVKKLKKALMLIDCKNEKDFKNVIKDKFFKNKNCSNICYYQENLRKY